jgi:hypothetical protein
MTEYPPDCAGAVDRAQLKNKTVARQNLPFSMIDPLPATLGEAPEICLKPSIHQEVRRQNLTRTMN